MSTATRRPALGAEEWISEGDGPALYGSRCVACGVVAFPAVTSYCPNPDCGSREHERHRLASTGNVWSYTNAAYQPPSPYISGTDPYEPFGIAAVELDADGLVVLGQLAAGHSIDELTGGTRVELVIEPLYVDDDRVERTVWKWRPIDG